jgi:hypothetical protein
MLSVDTDSLFDAPNWLSNRIETGSIGHLLSAYLECTGHIRSVRGPGLMMSPEAHRKWEERLKAAALRCQLAQVQVAETAIARLHLPRPDGYHAHNLALREEISALREYRSLLTEFAGLMNWPSPDRS